MSSPEGILGASFIEGTKGRLFVTLRRPASVLSGSCALLIAPFGEEMNKSRRMYALVANGLTAAGMACLSVDLYGTGDSEGEFREASLEGWLQDLQSAVDWAKSQGWFVDRLLATRIGCALSVMFAERYDREILRSVWWQPALDGRRLMSQLIRMRAMASEAGKNQESVAEIRAKFQSGQVVEIGGYELSPKLIVEIEALVAPVNAMALGSLHWFDIVRGAGAGVGAESTTKLLLDPCNAVRNSIGGEPFWSTVEIVTIPELVAASVTALTVNNE